MPIPGSPETSASRRVPSSVCAHAALERLERVVASHERRDRAGAQASRRLLVGGAQARGRRRAQPGGELAGGRRRRGAELAREALAQPREDPERGRGVPGGRERAHERTMRLLAERIELGAPASERQRLPGIGRGIRRRGQQRVERVGVRVARLQHPLVLQAGEQLAAAAREGRVDVARRRGGLEHAHVDHDRRPEADRIAGGDEVVADGRAQPHAAWRRLWRALSSRTSGRSLPASASRACRPGCSASQPARSRERRDGGRAIGSPSRSSASPPSSRTRSMARP